jgi:hypothetical protein
MSGVDPGTDLLKRARSEGAPLIDGESVAFLWRGERAPYLMGDFNNWDTTHALTLREIGPGI